MTLSEAPAVEPPSPSGKASRRNRAAAAAPPASSAAAGSEKPADIKLASAAESPIERIKRFLTTAGGHADLKLEFEDDPRCIHSSQHYLCYLSPVFESTLSVVAPEAADHITQRVGSRKKQHQIQSTSSSDGGKALILQGKTFETVLEFLSICYVNDDTQLAVNSRNLVPMLELADEWSVSCMLQKCSRVLSTWIDEVRSTPAWQALRRHDGMCGCPESKRKAMADCTRCGIHAALSKLVQAGQLAAKHNLQPIWGLVLDMMQSVPLKQACELLHSHPAYAEVSFKEKYLILVHCVSTFPSQDQAAA
eukprot:jgi/Tetstr1/439880/TSEL_028288.t1